MITIKVIATPKVEVVNGVYTVSVPVAAFDYSDTNKEWLSNLLKHTLPKIGENTLVVTGTTTDSVTDFMNKLRTEANKLRNQLTAELRFAARLSNLIGVEL